MPRTVADLSAADACTRLPGIGTGLAAKLAGLDIHCLGDLLLHRPLRYEDRTRLTPVAALQPRTQALAVVRVEAAEVRHGGRRRSLLVTTSDGHGRLWVRLFHFSMAQQRQLVAGVWLRLFGEARVGMYGFEMVHPEYRLFADRAEAEAFTPELVPVYPAVSGLSQKRLRTMTGQALDLLDRPEFWPECLPHHLGQAFAGYDGRTALRCLHRPDAGTDLVALAAGIHPAVARLAFEELLGRQLALRTRRRRIKRACAPALDKPQLTAFFRQLGFTPTTAQQRVIGEVLADMARAQPMLRLVQGDVGSGKTVVAAAAAVGTAAAGWQAAFMAPTELLAEQHYANLSRWLLPLAVPVWLVTGKNAADAETLAAIEAGQPGVIVGTHALFQEATHIGCLGLCVVDEQHRFGVNQRLALREKAGAAGVVAHQLIMTATPIPRTLAMSAYADLDTSVIDELPPGRSPVVTVAVPATRRQEVIARMAAAVGDGRQVYWVCTLIEDSEKLEAQAAEATAEVLAETLPQAHVGLAHGRMRTADKQRAMLAFKQGRIDVLVATTVVEVGVDVPNASLMIIENAERLGLAQLHQLRGRVGRGARQSHCVLLYQPPLSAVARRRLSVLRDTDDGFAIARADLELRGPGEVLGTRQTGLAGFRIADLLRDTGLAERAQACADDMLSQHPRMSEQLIKRWVGAGDNYASV